MNVIKTVDVVLLLSVNAKQLTIVTVFYYSEMGVFVLQDKVVAELDGIFEGSERPVVYEDTQNMRYLEQVIQESLRLYPPVPYIGRKATTDIHLGL